MLTPFVFTEERPRRIHDYERAVLERFLEPEEAASMSRHVYDCHVRFSDVDIYGHVNNVKYFEYFQEARIAFLMSLGDPLLDPGADPTMRQVVARIDVDYKRPILFRPEPYDVRDLGDPDRHVVVRPGLPDRRRGGHRLLQGGGAAGRLRRVHPALAAAQRRRAGPARRPSLEA